MIPSDNQIAKEQRRFPGLGKLQAINRLRSIDFIRQQQRASIFTPRLVEVEPVTAVWAPSPARLTELLALPRALTSDEMLELTAFERDAA